MADEAPARITTEAEQADPAHGGKPTVAVKVYAPFKIYFEGDAYSVSAVNESGPFDVLPQHHNFLCMLVPCTVRIQTTDGASKDIKLSRALMHVKANRVVIFVDV